MIGLGALWLPILLSAVLVFVASSIIHMVLPYHRSDYRQLPDEDGVRAALRSEAVAPGLYTVPYCTDPKEMGSEEMMAKFEEGPVAFVTVMESGPPAMGK